MYVRIYIEVALHGIAHGIGRSNWAWGRAPSKVGPMIQPRGYHRSCVIHDDTYYRTGGCFLRQLYSRQLRVICIFMNERSVSHQSLTCLNSDRGWDSDTKSLIDCTWFRTLCFRQSRGWISPSGHREGQEPGEAHQVLEDQVTDPRSDLQDPQGGEVQRRRRTLRRSPWGGWIRWESSACVWIIRDVHPKKMDSQTDLKVKTDNK